MKLVPIEELYTYSARLDIFGDATPISQELLAAGVIPLLPVCDRELVWGFGLLRACGAAGLDGMYCTEGAWSQGGKLLLALELESRTGAYTTEEQVAVALLAEELTSVRDLEAISLAVAGNRGFFLSIERFNALPAHLKIQVESGRLNLKTARRVVDLPAAVCDAACGYSHFSHSELRIFLGLLYEISMRDSMTVLEVTKVAYGFLESPDPMASLYRFRNPELSAFERRFEAVCLRYLAGSGITLKPPKYFEGDSYQISFSFANGGELKKRTETLKGLEDASDELEDLL